MAVAYRLAPGEVRVNRHGDTTDRVAVLVPGGGYTVDMPLLYFTARALMQRGWAIDEVWWRPTEDDPYGWALAQGTALLDRLSGAGQPLVVAKSLGSCLLPLLSGPRWAGIWFTPLLRHPPLVPAAEALNDRHLLIGSPADHSWDDAVADRSGARMMRLDHANRNLERPDTATSIRLLQHLHTAVTAFLDNLT